MMTHSATVLLAALLMALAAFSQASDRQNATSNKLQDPSEDPTRTATIIIGVIATTTLSVLIILIPTLVYYKLRESREDEVMAVKM